MLAINKLTKIYQGKVVLNDVSFRADEGQVIVLIGPSGSGKSTILRCINGLEDYNSGSVDLGAITPPKIGMVFQDFNLFHNMTLLENLIYAPINVLGFSIDKAVAIAHHWLEKVNMLQFKDCYTHTLSGGQKQRASIIRTLCMEPSIMLLDEPTSALDPENVKDVLDMLKSLSYMGITMLIVTHAIRFASSVADRVLFLDHGNLVEDCSADQFFSSPQTKRARDFLKAVSILHD